MEELAAAEAEAAAGQKRAADAKRAAEAKAKREKELRRSKPQTTTAKTSPPPPVAGKSARKPRQSDARRPPKLLLEAPKLHDLPLDGPRTTRATVKALPPLTLRTSPPLAVLLAAFASVLSRHARQDVVVVGFELCGNQPERRVHPTILH